MSEYFIVTSYDYARHATLGEAEKARNAMIQRTGRQFRVLRCKASLHGAGHFPRLVTLLRRLLRDGLTDENSTAAADLLAAIETRTPRLAEAAADAGQTESLFA